MARSKLSASEIKKRQRAGAYHDGSKPLTAKRLQRLKGEGRYHDADVRGLYLQVTDKGARSWLLRFELNGRERMMGLGSASDFTLAQARERAREARRLIADGIDPVDTKRAAKVAAKAAAAKKLTFREAAQRYFDQNESKWRNASHRDQFLASLRSYAFPYIGELDVATIGIADVLRCIEPIWTSKAITADRVRNRIEGVIDWAVVRGHRPAGTNPARWKGHLDQVLPPARKVAPVEHFSAIDYRELPLFMAALRDDDSVAARALEFLILTAARSGEVIGATWAEIDIDDATWTIPPSRMKAKREHRVPLSAAAVDLLRKLPRDDDNPFVFMGPRPGRGFSRMALARVMEQLKRSETVHGFRSAFSDWSNEETSHSNHTIEISLAHNVGSEVERSYRRGPMLAKRIRLMKDWSKYCCSPSPPVKAKDTHNVVSIQGRR